MPRPTKRLLALSVDAFLCSLTVWLAMALSPLLALPVFIVSGLYRAIFRYAGMAALVTVVKAVFI